jgi:plasmid maintenance system killer protein
MKGKIVLLFILLFLGSFCQADDRARDRATLRGIQSIIVKVHSLSAEWQAELEKVGLSESVLQSSIEQQLHTAGIEVLAEEASKQSEFEGVLNVRLKFVKPEPDTKKFSALDDNQEKIEIVDARKKYLYAIRLNLRQLVALKREPSLSAFSITWQAESAGIRRLALIKDDIRSLVDVFIEAYTSENPNLIKK